MVQVRNRPIRWSTKKDERDSRKFVKIRTQYTSNPDIGVARVPVTTAHVQQRKWGNVSDHRPVLFEVRASLKLRDMRKWIAKSLFDCPDATRSVRKEYSEGMDRLLENLGKVKTGD